jgi:hypothetical protein
MGRKIPHTCLTFLNNQDVPDIHILAGKIAFAISTTCGSALISLMLIGNMRLCGYASPNTYMFYTTPKVEMH